MRPSGKDDGNRKPWETEDTEMLSTADIQSLNCYTQQHSLGLKNTEPTSGRKTNHIGQKQDHSSFCGRMLILIFERDKGN